MKQIQRFWTLALVLFISFIISACTPTTVNSSQEVFQVTGQRQLVLEPLDHLKRAVGAHIQLRYQDKPTAERDSRINVDPVGWHNYQFDINDSGEKAWLMNRGHLVGYQFSGLNDELRNLTPMTAYLNTGSISGTDDTNPEGMLYYENRLAKWLKTHKNDWLDYKVTPVYDGDELIPRQVRLQYVGLTSKGDIIPITFGTSQEVQDDRGITTTTLDNTSSNAIIDYKTGEATPVSKAVQQQSTQQSDRTVYVANNGNSDVYWYDKANMPPKTNLKNVVEMKEAKAISLGKTHTTKE